MTRKLLAMSVLFLSVIIWNSTNGEAGGKKDSAWRPFLAAETYKELTQRSIQAIEATAQAKPKDWAEKIEVEAAILVGYTLSVKNPAEQNVAKLRGAALLAARAARRGDLKRLAAFEKSFADVPAPVHEIENWKAVLQERQWMMEIFRGKAKGGEGLHAELQYHPKLKNLNGIEAFLGAIAGKKLSDENLDQIAKELPNLASRIAVIGSLTHELPQEKNVAEWQALADQMRDAASALAEAGRKKNADGVLKSAQTLENSCTQCHMKFKKN